MPADIYDSFIIREIELAADEFIEGKLIGKLLGKYQLGINDTWYSFRIDEMIRAGSLEIVEEASDGELAYRRRLRKIG